MNQCNFFVLVILAVVACSFSKFMLTTDCPQYDRDPKCLERIANSSDFCFKGKPNSNHYVARMFCPWTCMNVLGYVKEDRITPDCDKAAEWLKPADCAADSLDRFNMSMTPMCERRSGVDSQFCSRVVASFKCAKTCKATCNCNAAQNWLKPEDCSADRIKPGKSVTSTQKCQQIIKGHPDFCNRQSSMYLCAKSCNAVCSSSN